MTTTKNKQKITTLRQLDRAIAALETREHLFDSDAAFEGAMLELFSRVEGHILRGYNQALRGSVSSSLLSWPPPDPATRCPE